MRSSYFDFFGEVLLEVRGEGGRSTSQFREMYPYFESDVSESEPDIVVERTTATPDPDIVLGDPTDYYGWTGDLFVVRNGSNFMAVEPGWEHIYVSPGWEPFYATYPIEFAIRSRLVERNEALIHASGVELDGETTVFPAWRGAGKTNTLLSLLRAGGHFLADDRLWVGADGDARGYPLGVNLQPYNVESFPEIELEYDGLVDRAKPEIDQYIKEHFASGTSIPEKGVRFLARQVLESNERNFTHIDSLFPDAEYTETSSIDNVILLRAAPNSETVSLEPASPETMLPALRAINNYEWNHRLGEYFNAYDSLVPGASMADRLHDVIEREEEILVDLLRQKNTYVAEIPRNKDWGESGIDRDVVETIRSLEGRHDREVAYHD
ncbi:hypothetical protein [Natronomonas amylolytica]|uniref:hypothetical protein n=1 Tax=Natronomonas amylolytica TaxID=3108498 RepID=UPI00300ACDF9